MVALLGWDGGGGTTVIGKGGTWWHCWDMVEGGDTVVASVGMGLRWE